MLNQQSYLRAHRRQIGLLFAVLMVFLLIELTPLTGAAQVHNSNIGRVLTAAEESAGEAVQLNGKVTGLFSQSLQRDPASGLIQITILSSIFEFHGSFTPEFRTIKSEFRFKNKDLVNYLGHDKRVTVYDETNKIKVKYYLNDRLKAEKSFSGKEVIDSDIIIFYLQDRLLKGAGSLKYGLFGKKDGVKVSAGFDLVTANDFVKLAPEYDFPANMRRISSLKNEVLVYIMELKGLSRLFYSHKYYYVFEKHEPYRFIAYWGGPLSEAEYAYVLNLDPANSSQ